MPADVRGVMLLREFVLAAQYALSADNRLSIHAISIVIYVRAGQICAYITDEL